MSNTPCRATEGSCPRGHTLKDCHMSPCPYEGVGPGGLGPRPKWYLFFDTETCGLPARWDAPASDIENWPRLVQLAWALYSPEGRLIEAVAAIVRPEGFTIPEEAFKVHGITTERALKEGFPLSEVVGAFHGVLLGSDLVVGHNVSYDRLVIGAEFCRLGLPPPGRTIHTYCTMKGSQNLCALPGRGSSFKYPKLVELHQKLFNEGLVGAHDAMVDLQATARCFWELHKRGLVPQEVL